MRPSKRPAEKIESQTHNACQFAPCVVSPIDDENKETEERKGLNALLCVTQYICTQQLRYNVPG